MKKKTGKELWQKNDAIDRLCSLRNVLSINIIVIIIIIYQLSLLPEKMSFIHSVGGGSRAISWENWT